MSNSVNKKKVKDGGKGIIGKINKDLNLFVIVTQNSEIESFRFVMRKNESEIEIEIGG